MSNMRAPIKHNDQVLTKGVSGKLQLRNLADSAYATLVAQQVEVQADPTTALEVATKQYADAVAQGLRQRKEAVRAKSTAALAAYSRTGNVITASANGALAAQDGVTLVANDRFLLTHGAVGADNGIYVVTAVGDGSNPFVLTRATDADADAEVSDGLFTFVQEGTLYANTGWTLTTNNPITLNTTALVFAQFSAAGQLVFSSAFTQTGLNVDLSDTGISAATYNGTVTFDAKGRATAATNSNYKETVGNGTATSFNIDHNLGTTDVMVELFEVDTGETIEADVARTTTNRVVVSGFVTAPTNNNLRVLVRKID